MRLWFGDNCVNIPYANAKTETYIDMDINADDTVRGLALELSDVVDWKGLEEEECLY